VTTLIAVVISCCLWLGLSFAALWLWSRRREVPRTCGICGGPIDPDLDAWRWAAHLDAMVHTDCIPAWLRAADRAASRGCSMGRGYVQLWLDEGDGMRLMEDAAQRTEAANG